MRWAGTIAVAPAQREHGRLACVNLALRLLLLRLRVGQRPRLGAREVSRVTMRPWVGDLGLSDHLNNGVYLSMMDVGRADLWFRSGLWARMRAAGAFPVVAAATISYRKSLRRGQRFVLETRALAVRDRSLFLEQRFVVDGEMFARAFVTVRVLAQTGGGVSAQQLSEFVGEDLTGLPLEEWMPRWVDDVTLPPTREPAPSVWD